MIVQLILSSSDGGLGRPVTGLRDVGSRRCLASEVSFSIELREQVEEEGSIEELSDIPYHRMRASGLH